MTRHELTQEFYDVSNNIQYMRDTLEPRFKSYATKCHTDDDKNEFYTLDSIDPAGSPAAEHCSVAYFPATGLLTILNEMTNWPDDQDIYRSVQAVYLFKPATDEVKRNYLELQTLQVSKSTGRQALHDGVMVFDNVDDAGIINHDLLDHDLEACHLAHETLWQNQYSLLGQINTTLAISSETFENKNILFDHKSMGRMLQDKMKTQHWSGQQTEQVKSPHYDNLEFLTRDKKTSYSFKALPLQPDMSAVSHNFTFYKGEMIHCKTDLTVQYNTLDNETGMVKADPVLTVFEDANGHTDIKVAGAFGEVHALKNQLDYRIDQPDEVVNAYQFIQDKRLHAFMEQVNGPNLTMFWATIRDLASTVKEEKIAPLQERFDEMFEVISENRSSTPRNDDIRPA